MSNSLAAFSQSIAQLAAESAGFLSAIRIGPNRHMTGLVCEGDVIVTTDQELPALDAYTVVLPHGNLAAARPILRDPACNLALLRLNTPFPVANPDVATVAVGSLALVVAADADASPTVRLTVVHRFLRVGSTVPVLDLPTQGTDPGSLVLDAEGRLIGLAALGPGGEAIVIPAATIGQILVPALHLAVPTASPPPAPLNKGRGWLGVSLQPITVPEAIFARAGQSSGRMVVSITRGGPAEQAGLRVGDVLLALNGTSASGPHALRAFLDSEPIGSTVEVRLLREGDVITTHLTVAAQRG
jgi:S1-C subfamily serine protease